MNHLNLAYAATWLIHIAYLAYLAVKFAPLKREIEELRKK